MRALAAVALAALAAPASAYVRTSNEVTGAEVFWPLPVVPYELSSAPSSPSPGCAAGPAGDPVEDAVRASFATWSPSCAGGARPNLQLLFGGRISEATVGLAGTGENVVVVRNGWCSQDPVASRDPCMTDPDVDCGALYNCFEDAGAADWDTVALTTVLYDPRSGRIFDADMELIGWDGRGQGGAIPTSSLPPRGYYFTCDADAGAPRCATYGQAGCIGYDLANTATHEAGHFVGFAHPCERVSGYGVPLCSSTPPPGEVPYAERTMYPLTSLGDTAKRALSPDEAAAVCAVYPPARSGCGAGPAGAPALVALLGLLALRARRRVS
jgi:uncharacterized protein (TIGR03382 family)